MAKRKSKLKQMAEAGNPWAIKTLAEASRIGRLAWLRGQAMQRIKQGCARDDDERLLAMVLPKQYVGSHQAEDWSGRPLYDGNEPPWSEVLGERMARDRDPGNRGLSFWL